MDVIRNVEFGCIGVDVANYTPNSVYDLLGENGLDTFISNKVFSGLNRVYGDGSYLQTAERGVICEQTSVCVLNGYIHCTTDMDTFLLILRTAVLDINLANALVSDLYREGLIKPRNIL